MKIEDIIDIINIRSNPKAGMYFELFVQNLLKLHLEKQGKHYDIEYPIDNIRLDGYAKDGIDHYEGPVFVEIKGLRSPNSGIIDSIIRTMTHILDSTAANYLILICPIASDKMRTMFRNETPRLILWGISEINELIDAHKEEAEYIANNLFKLEIESDLSKNDSDWKKAREELLMSVKKEYEEGNISLLLGAGVSCSAGLPNWETLLNSLYANLVNKIFNNATVNNDTIKAITNKFIEINNSSALAIARYLKAGLSSKDNDAVFISAVKNALYTSQRTSSSLIESIRNLCIPKSSGAKVKSIITYNFDDLIEISLSGAELKYKTIYRDEEQYESHELPIYHVHGFIPGNGKLDRETPLIFSEEAYHKVYSEPYHWSNLVQLATLRENNCLMIGLSLSDPNLRRLLEIAAQKQSKNCRHFAFIRILKNDRINATDNVKIDEASVNKILQVHHIIQEKMMDSLGIKVIWVEDYNEIPVLLDKIRE